MDKNIWTIVESEHPDHIALFTFLMTEYCRIFGMDTMTNEPCIIYNDINANYPMLVINNKPILIRLAQKSLSFWCQTIFQLSHELCHYAMRQHKADKDFTLSWFEEIVCEAMSLYALQFASKEWKQCQLSWSNPSYAESIENYLNDELNREGTDLLQQCTTVELLKEYEINHSGDRDSHKNERNALFYAITTCPEECRCFCDYSKYVNKETNVTINFSSWENNDPSQLIRLLHKLQPCCNIEGEI